MTRFDDRYDPLDIDDDRPSRIEAAAEEREDRRNAAPAGRCACCGAPTQPRRWQGWTFTGNLCADCETVT